MKAVFSCGLGLSILLLAGCDTTSSVPSDSYNPYAGYNPYASYGGSYSNGWDPQVYSNYVNNHYNSLNGANTPNCGGRVVSEYSVCPQ